MKYYIETHANIHIDYQKRWWIDPNVLGNGFIESDDPKKAIREFIEKKDEYKSYHSANSLKHLHPFYVGEEDPIQIGYSYTTRTDISDDRRWYSIPIEVWADIYEVNRPDFK